MRDTKEKNKDRFFLNLVFLLTSGLTFYYLLLEQFLILSLGIRFVNSQTVRFFINLDLAITLLFYILIV